MSVNISEILSRPSCQRDYVVEPEMDKLLLRRTSYRISHKEPFTLSVQKKDNKLYITGSTEVRLIMLCDRCLTEVEQPFQVTIDRVYDPGLPEDGERDVDELSFLDGCMLDADKLIHDELVLALPTKVLCKEDCKGLCSICGTNLNLSSCNCSEKIADPRMAAIKDIFRNWDE